MEKNQFKPFDKVLVRDRKDQEWAADFYSHKDEINMHQCVSSNWNEVIPYNEETKHLLGTNKPYKEPEPKVWKVRCHKNNQVFHFTNDELKRFIENAVINNKDIQWFTTTYDENNN